MSIREDSVPAPDCGNGLSVDGLTLRRRGKVVLDSVTVSLRTGVTVLLGPNGSGKSSLLSVLAGVLVPAGGVLRVAGQPLTDAERRRLRCGYAPQRADLPDYARVWDVLMYLAALKGVVWSVAAKQCKAIADSLNLSSVLETPVSALSGGMRRRILVAQALIGNPELLLLDEPTAELDGLERDAFHGLIRSMLPRIVVVSTHVPGDAEALADMVAILHQGRLIAAASPADLVAGVAGRVWTLSRPNEQGDAPPSGVTVISRKAVPGGSELRVFAQERPVGADPVRPTLNDAYLAAVAQVSVDGERA